ncbi:MAG: hypothetical protein MJA84_18445 [Firmicutes bacterium]|nr:hypothetical protein [Bacillota bacterium]
MAQSAGMPQAGGGIIQQIKQILNSITSMLSGLGGAQQQNPMQAAQSPQLLALGRL